MVWLDNNNPFLNPFNFFTKIQTLKRRRKTSKLFKTKQKSFPRNVIFRLAGRATDSSALRVSFRSEIFHGTSCPVDIWTKFRYHSRYSCPYPETRQELQQTRTLASASWKRLTQRSAFIIIGLDPTMQGGHPLPGISSRKGSFWRRCWRLIDPVGSSQVGAV